MEKWKKDFRIMLKSLYKEDYFYLESYLEDFIAEELKKAREEGYKAGYQEARKDVVAVDDLQMTYEWAKDVDTSKWI